MKDLRNHKASDIHGINLEFLKCIANDLCEPITKLFNLVAQEGILATWTINIIQITFKSSERCSPGNYKTRNDRNNLWQALWLYFRRK